GLVDGVRQARAVPQAHLLALLAPGQFQHDALQVPRFVGMGAHQPLPGLRRRHGYNRGAVPRSAPENQFLRADAAIKGKIEQEQGLAHVGPADDQGILGGGHDAPKPSRSWPWSSINCSLVGGKSPCIRRRAWRRMAYSIRFRTPRALPKAGSAAARRVKPCSWDSAAGLKVYCRCCSIWRPMAISSSAV